jgi:hypothetical protein
MEEVGAVKLSKADWSGSGRFTAETLCLFELAETFPSCPCPCPLAELEGGGSCLLCPSLAGGETFTPAVYSDTDGKSAKPPSS